MINLLGSSSLIGWIVLIVILLLIAGFIVAVCLLVPVKIWFKSLTNNSKVSMVQLMALKQRKLNVAEIVDYHIAARKAGIYISLDEIETHMAAGGNVNKVINALVSAENAKVNLSVDLAKAIDLSGKDVCQAVKNSLTPKVIETQEICAISKDGIEVKVKAKITIKALLTKFIGGTGEDTILAKATEGIVVTIGALSDHREILQNPDLISKTVLAKGLDKGSSYQVLSVDIVSVDVGKNIGAQLRMDEVEIEKRRSSARAEEVRAQAVLEEQQMRIKNQELEAERIRAEAEIPKAVAKAFEEGKISVMDYYKMQNIIADTNMRKAWTGNNDNED